MLWRLRAVISETPVKALPKTWGVYRIQKPRSKKTLYIGTSENIYRRIYSNLLTESGQHILKTKLRRFHGWKYPQIKRYLGSCKVQCIICDKNEYLSLEHFAIAILQPEMNDKTL